MTCLTASSAVDDEGKLRQVWLTAGGSVGWVTAVHGGQVNVGIARTQLTVLQFRETRDVVAKFVIFPAETEKRTMCYMTVDIKWVFSSYLWGRRESVSQGFLWQLYFSPSFSLWRRLVNEPRLRILLSGQSSELNS